MKHPSVICITRLCDPLALPPGAPSPLRRVIAKHGYDASGIGTYLASRADGTVGAAQASAAQGRFGCLLVLPKVIGVTLVA